MIRCPSCHHSEPVGSLFCTECGAQLLLFETSRPAVAVQGKEPETYSTAGGGPDTRLHNGSSGTSVKLRVVRSGQILSLVGEEITLGRASGQQPILPEIDLAPHNALEDGVSRFHATITIQDGKVSIVDLGSLNGTRVNGRKLAAHVCQPLEHGDFLTLGKLRLQILIRG